MRNTLILAVVCLSLFSCNKVYTCECVEKGTATVATSFDVNAVKKSHAKDKCTKYQTDVNTTFLGTTTEPQINCAIK